MVQILRSILYVYFYSILMFFFYYFSKNSANARLEELLSRQNKIERQMNNIGRSLVNLNVAKDEGGKVNTMIETTSILAENVSAKVRRLDEARVSNYHLIFLHRVIFNKIMWIFFRNVFPSVNNVSMI